MMRTILLISLIAFSTLCHSTTTLPIHVVAAENIYGSVAKELGGNYVVVTSLLNNPTSDPHLFSITPSTAKAMTEADIIIYNGADYDPWIQPLLTMATPSQRKVIEVASLTLVHSGDNPHIWYSPETMPLFAKAFVAALIQTDPAHKLYYQSQLQQFNNRYQRIFKTVSSLKKRFQNIDVIATEPIFGYMAHSIGLKMHGDDFQIKIMNDVPPNHIAD